MNLFCVTRTGSVESTITEWCRHAVASPLRYCYVRSADTRVFVRSGWMSERDTWLQDTCTSEHVCSCCASLRCASPVHAVSIFVGAHGCVCVCQLSRLYAHRACVLLGCSFLFRVRERGEHAHLVGASARCRTSTRQGE